ncbi:MAG TPA: allantoinase AllB [Polyangiaceae bacterium]|nr:allantoinase AllB [Polyangiaceae bacterium]
MTLRGVQSRRVVLPEGVSAATLLFQDGKISEVLPGTGPLEGVLDAGELVISPGLVDCHVHINEPGRAEWEGFDTATRAAAAGGVTTLVDMPLNCLPVTTSAAALETKLRACEGQLHVDVGFWGGVVPGNAAELAGLARAGALGCKAFLVHSGIDEFPNATERDLRQAMPVLRDHGLPLLAHAELDLGADVFETSPRAYRGYLESRPRSWEDAAIALLIELCRETRCPVHIVHLSSASAVPLLREAKAKGLPLTVETCPHYLCFEAETIPDGATHFKCAPPIRERDNREALWQALFEGVIDFVISDHSPCTPALKLAERGDFQAAWGGVASLQLGLPAIWSEASRRGAGLEDLARWMSSAPARFAGVAGRKGSIAVGAAADLVIWDPDAAFEVSPDGLHFKHKISPYLGQSLRGVVRRTLLGGEIAYAEGSFDTPPRGRALLHRDTA